MARDKTSNNKAHRDEVGRYYDANTRRFLRFGRGGEALAIHREIWAEGIKSPADAINYTNDLVLENFRELDPELVLDIGCGVGGTMAYLASNGGCRKEGRQILGLTLSTVQAELGNKYLERKDLTECCAIYSGDATGPGLKDSMALQKNSVDLIYAIEAFQHFPDPEVFFDNVRELLKTNGRLLIIDDFLSDRIRDITGNKKRALERRERISIEEFLKGWHVGNIGFRSDLESMAENYQLSIIEEKDLSPFLKLGLFRDRIIRIMAFGARLLDLRSPWWDNIRGGNALQKGYEQGLFSYRYFAFKKY